MSEKDNLEEKNIKSPNKDNPTDTDIKENSASGQKKTSSKIEKKPGDLNDKDKKSKPEKTIDKNQKEEVAKKIDLKDKPQKVTENKKSLTNNEEVKKKNTSDKKQNTNENQSKSNEKIQNEFIEKLVSINRVAKVVKGGRRFSFAALVVVGDGNGMVGHGKGKAKEVPEAIKKATDEAKNTMIRVPLRQGRTLHHDIKGRFDSGNVFLRSAPSGTGVIAGGPMRAVFEALGIQDIVAKSIGSSNPHNMVRATFEALKVVSSPKIIASRRGLKINDITKRRKNTTGSENVKT